MARIAFGADVVERSCVILGNVNVNSPLVWDAAMTGALRAYAAANQAPVVVPFILGGAMGPVTLAGAIAQAHAETMVGVALGQLTRPGSPVIYGNFLSSMALRSGSPTFGTPEPALGSLVVGQMARRVGLPLRCSGAFTSSKVPDGQAMMESAVSMQAAILCGAHFILHSAGWLEGGLAMGYEKFVMDADFCGALHTYLEGIDLVRGPVRARRLRRARSGQALLLRAAHPAPLRDGVLGQLGGGQHVLRAVARRRRAPGGGAGGRPGGRDAGRVRATPDRPRGRRGPARVHGPPQGRDAGHVALDTQPMTDGRRSAAAAVRLKHLTLRNRVFSSSHEPAYSDGGMPTDRYRLYHVEKAKGGIGMTMTAGSAVVAEDSPPAFGNLHAYEDEIVPWMRRMTDEVHEHGAACMIQLTHLGRRTGWAQDDWLPVVAPSPLREPAHRAIPKEAEDWDIERIVGKYADAAERMQAGGHGRHRDRVLRPPVRPVLVAADQPARPTSTAARSRTGCGSAGRCCRPSASGSAPTSSSGIRMAVDEHVPGGIDAADRPRDPRAAWRRTG